MDHFAAISTFVRVVETGSFSVVAKEMDLGQPAISKSIASFERRLGVRLLLRTMRKLIPTETGRAFYEQAKLAIEQAERAETIARESHSGLSGRLRVSAPVTFARLHLIPRLGQFLDRHPALRWISFSATSMPYHSALISGTRPKFRPMRRRFCLVFSVPYFVL
jgi:DNA-binding transcriptional LysR family regulator